MATQDPLLQSYQLKHLTLRNRIMSTAHEPAYSEDGMPKERYRLYHQEKAKGGMAMTMIGGSSIISPDSPEAFGNLHVYKDEIVPWFRELSDACHQEDTAVMCQITHLGRRTSWSQDDWLPVLAPSPVREPAHRAFPKQAEDWDLARITRDYAAAAARCQAGGLDGVEIEAYGHFMDAFWSPATNHRDDDYGGSLENRLRFTFAVIDAIRKEVGAAYILGLRLVVDEDWDKGLSREEGLEIAQRLVGSGQVDFLNVIRGHIDSDESLSHVIPNMGARSSPHLDFTGEVRAATRFPVFHAARINDVATARHAVAEGKLDMVGMTRAHLADPHITRKIMAGREEEIRPCVGAGYCIDRIYEGRSAYCIHNPATGREATIPQEVQRGPGPAKKVVVVGGGPAGLEAARVSAARGHEVVLFEAASEPGGQVRLTAQLQRRREIIGIVDWRVERCADLGVTLKTSSYAEAADVLAESPDIVIVATGGLPNTGFLEAGEDLVVTSWDVLAGDSKAAQEILLFDDNGAHPGMMAAESLACAGATLEYVTPERSVAPEIGGTNSPIYLKAFSECGVKITLTERLTAVRRDGNRLAATLFNEYSKTSQERLVDQVVVEHGTLPLDELYFELKPDSVNQGAVDYDALITMQPQALAANPDGSYQLFRVGDAVSSRNIHAAIYDSLRLCLTF
ncbi:NADH:flavin oxidoreductase [Denitrobaculum tricleocarpae]|uniref:NADH:flavin oxidoreductase n=1 Tax=Denitrobaculum tricleocarpae TaxID=2591009 RepID=A0A545TFC5_9PROT|nr:NADH:flavin oxidoreductase [Denitrobaculum tricleocarpae]TQV75866.1 NADH:flavin oxidoreductase [Denitrobaculum tricleocarpae]